MFSGRAGFDLTPNRLSGVLLAKRRSGARVLDLTESNPTRAGMSYPDDLLAVLADPGNLVYEPAPLGLPEARAAVARDYERRGAPVDPGRIVITAGTSEAYAFLLKLLCDAGDEVLVPAPSYPLFDFLAQLEAVSLRRYRLAYDGEWHVPAAALEPLLGPRTRAVAIVSPNNPTGSYLKRDEALELESLCARRGVAILADEVFADYALTADSRRIPTLARDAAALTFSLGGLSKSAGLPQLKLAWIAVSGPERLCRDALARLEVIADSFLSVSTPVQRAAPVLLARLPELQAPIAARVRANASWLSEKCAGSPATLLRAEGGWSAVLRVPATLSEEERACRLLEAEDVLVHPGFFFDFAHEAFLVVSLLPEEGVFREGVSRLLGTLL
jgi:aspartate/methionine/tyrosine aminotransferase